MMFSLAFGANRGTVHFMRDLLLLAVHLVVTFAKLLRPGGVRAVAAESLALKHQLLISNRARQRAPNLTPLDRFVLGITTLFVNPRRIAKLGVIIKTATLHKFHKALVNRKYQLLVSSSTRPCKPGPKGPSPRIDCGNRRNEAPQSQNWLHAHRPADLICLWPRHRQRCRASRTGEALSSR